MNHSSSHSSHVVLKHRIKTLADKAFHQHLISGYGDSEFPNQYQIVYQGKPRHFSLDHALVFLRMLVDLHPIPPIDSANATRTEL
jgi:hypothetical protein